MEEVEWNTHVKARYVEEVLIERDVERIASSGHHHISGITDPGPTLADLCVDYIQGRIEVEEFERRLDDVRHELG